MSRAGRIAIAAVVVIAALLALNTAGLNNQTKSAEIDVEGAKILQLGGGSLQVLDSEPQPGAERGIPVVLIHCYTCSLRWWDMVAEPLSERHRIIRLDLLGHGGSEKPAEGYDIESQSELVAEALGQLGVEGALIVGHSLGASVATALAQRHSEFADRVALIGAGPDPSFHSLGLMSGLSRTPVIGQALWRITPDFAARSGTSIAFADNFETATGFENSDQPIDDLRAMTYPAYERWPDANEEYTESLGLDRRLAGANMPVMVLLGAEDQIVDSEAAAAAYEANVPTARVRVMETVGHSPSVEAPEETAALLEQFAREAEPPPAPPKAQRSQRNRKRR